MRIAFRKRAPGLFSTLVRLWTRSEYDHCELLLSGHTMIGATNEEGVRVMFLVESFAPSEWDVVEIPATPTQDALVYRWAMDEVGCEYDWLGIIFCQVFRFGRHSRSKWFCSEFCTAALQQVGGLRGVKPHWQCPGKLYQLLTGVRK